MHACVGLGITNYGNLVTDTTDNFPHYDAVLALDTAGDVPAIRDQVVNDTLEQFSDGGELVVLFDVSRYRSDQTQSRALAHSAVNCAN